MSTEIVPLADSHFEGLYQVLDVVAREKRYLAMTQALPRDQSYAYYRDVLTHDRPHFVALADGKVAGWCDILPAFGEARRHVGLLGLGLAPHARGKGLGAQLLTAAIDKAWRKGLTRIELTVRADNHNARALYERLGFQHEGTKRREFFVDGVYYDTLAMALLREAA